MERSFYEEFSEDGFGSTEIPDVYNFDVVISRPGAGTTRFLESSSGASNFLSTLGFSSFGYEGL